MRHLHGRAPVERRKLMRMLGAKVTVDAGMRWHGAGRGAAREARPVPVPPVRERPTGFHRDTTGPEIIADFEAEGKKLTHG